VLTNRSFLSILTICLLFCSCNPAKLVPEGKYLLVKNKIETDELKNDTASISKEKFESLLRQKPNRKILGLFRFHLGLYNAGTTGTPKDSSGFKKWLRRIGEAPVLIDSVATEKSKQQLLLYLGKNGFFNATVHDSIHPVPKKFLFFKVKQDSSRLKKAMVEYSIRYNEAYRIKSITYSTQDTGIIKMINYFQQSSLILPGDRYNEETFDKERDRITNNLKDRGYYFFSRNYITYQIDSSLSTHQVDVFMYINRVNENVSPSLAGNNPVEDHQVYHLRNIFVQVDFNPKDPDSSVPLDTTFNNGVYILSHGPFRVLRDNIISKNIFVKSGDRYLQRDLDYTYYRFQELNLFKFINLNFIEVQRDEAQKDFLLDLKIQLTPLDKQDFTIEQELSNTGGNIGLAATFGYRNKNLFRGAEVLEMKFKGGLEAIPNFNDSVEEKKFFFFNTYEIGPEISFTIRTAPPVTRSRYANPKTKFTIGYNYQERPDYKRSVTNFSAIYQYILSRNQRLFITLPEINAVEVDLSPEFQSKLEDLHDPRLIYTYQTHSITSIRATWINSNQSLTLAKNFIYLRVNGELAGKIFDFNLNPSEFGKADVDFSYHHYINRFNNIVYRIAVGWGFPYGNSPALPFEKSFFSGGANSVRAWNARTLGPGSYNEKVNIEQSGDIKIESNIEYRSELIRLSNGIVIEGAAFVDAGNVWTKKEDISRPGSQLEFDNLIPELGVGAGLGIRFNFSFFILRLDGGVKLRDPSLELSERWVYPNQKFVIGDVTGNLGIGYPF
jgi:outer membrane protein assembly factor BamA